ncbi:hypothetical protein Mal4_41640 [Maioricimonas rarisocia]|uniref:Uncharacterized protein n=1 Tax=Maioricimonas rarisocia TaxID=2528026 RepID=A0A517ZBF1_9PLAN|nr:hypothetical protein [Maioricimonas rarisocia]QDU39816.1 hypothetical protein Mal4_41640 [Maioricimonas rarisocia]
MLNRRRRATGLVLCVLMLLCGSGCQLGRTYFQMDSNSSGPFFGFDLLSLPRSASVNEADEEGRTVSLEAPPVNETPERRWPLWPGRDRAGEIQPVQHIPVPRTDRGPYARETIVAVETPDEEF